jgi:ABC-type Fe3+ transport system substrate-binding protein
MSRRDLLRRGIGLAAATAFLDPVLLACGGQTKQAPKGQIEKIYQDFVQTEMPGVPIDLLYAAQKEGTVTGYLQFAYGDVLTKGFKSAFPFIDVQTTVLTGAPLVTRFMGEARAGQFTADIVDFASLVDFATALKENFVMPYKLTSEAQFNMKQAVAGYTLPIAGDLLSIGYNPQRISDDQAKSLTTWASLLDSRWDGKKFAVAEVLAGGTTQLLNYYLYEKMGTQLWQRVAKSGYAIYPGGNPSIASVVSGQNDVSIGLPSSLTTAAYKKQMPLHWLTVKDWLATSYVQFISARAPHPNAAKLFQEYSGTPTAQRLMLDNSGVTYRKGITNVDALAKEKWYVKADPAQYWPYELSQMTAAMPGLVQQWRAIFK